MTTTDQINEAVLSCTMPSSGDGVSNAERASFVCEAFDALRLDLNKKMPYEACLRSKDATKVHAAIHLAQLQFQYTTLSRVEGLLDPERCDLYLAYLHLMIAKLGWHKKHLDAGKPTPPFSFLN